MRMAAVAAGIFTAGCQAYLPKSLDPQATAIHFGKRRLDDPQLRAALVSSGYWSRHNTWPPSPWKLRELQGAALYYHPEIAVAKAKAATAQAAIQTADTRPNPTLSFAPELGNPGGGVSPWVLGFTLDVPIETANKRGERTAQPPARRIWEASAPGSALHSATLRCVLRLALQLPKFEFLAT